MTRGYTDDQGLPARNLSCNQDRRYASALATYCVNALLWPFWLVPILIVFGVLAMVVMVMVGMVMAFFD